MAAQRHKPVRICSSSAAAARPFTIMREISRTLAAVRAAPSRQCHALVCVQSALWLAPPRQAAGAGRHPWRRPVHVLTLSKRPGVVGLRPPLKGRYARPAASGCGGSQSFLLARSRLASFRSRPGPRCHAKSNPGQPAEEQSAVPALAGFASPHPAGTSPGRRQAASRFSARRK